MNNTDLKQTWLDALRSDEYDQCKFRLHEKGAGFCCLGVAAVVWGLATPNEIDQPGTKEDEVYSKLKNEIPNDIYYDGIAMNDDDKSFREIADMIEERWVE